MCLEINAGSNRVIVDAGSGLRQLGIELHERQIAETHILLTHYHLDHVIGLTTFAPLFQKGTSVTVHAPILKDEHPEAILHRLLDEPYFPIPMKDAGASFTICGFRPGDTIPSEGFEIRTQPLSHPGGACGYRIDANGRSIAVVTDHEHSGNEPEPAIVRFCKGVDLLLYDAHWDEAVDYDNHRGWGHSTWQAGLRMLRAAGARRLGCLHHAPDASDGTLLEREAQLRGHHGASFFAREDETIDI